MDAYCVDSVSVWRVVCEAKVDVKKIALLPKRKGVTNFIL
jgi:hypothetical protein